MKQLNNSREDEVIYALISTKINGFPINIMVDSGAASSHITMDAVKTISGKIQKRRNPLQVLGFGNTKAQLITSYTTTTLKGIEGEEIEIDFNISNQDLVSSIPGVSSQIFDDYPHLNCHRDTLSAPIPREAQKIDAIIGLRDRSKIYDVTNPMNGSCPNICTLIRADGVSNTMEARKSIFGTLLIGGAGPNYEDNDDNFQNAVQNEPNEATYDKPESALATREIPIEILLRKAIDQKEDEECYPNKESKSALQKPAHDDFNKNSEVVPLGDGISRYKIKLTRLPENLYPISVNGTKITGNAINRFFSLEKRLSHPRNKRLREGVKERVDALINDNMMIPVGYWEDNKEEFLKNQEPGREKILLPWQMVLDENKAAEHSKIRMCLDGTESNRLIYKLETAMPELQDILMRWKTSNYWCTIDIVKMFWSIQTHEDDADLQHCVWRDSPTDKLMLYKFVRMVMGLTNSPGLARLVLLLNAQRHVDKYPSVLDIMENDTYMDDSEVLGNSEQEVISKAVEVIECLKLGSFKSGKILTDSKAIINSLPQEALHPSIIEAIEAKQDLIEGVLGNPVEFKHPTIEDTIIEDTKQLGIHIAIDLKAEECYLTYKHWYEDYQNEKFTKRLVAKSFAKAWNPLQEMGPLINPGKICLSKIWKLQVYLQKKQEQARFDFKEKGNYRPLAGRKDPNKATKWSILQKEWPSITWDNDLAKLDLDSLPDGEKSEAVELLDEIMKYWEIFRKNIKDLRNKKVKRNALAKIDKKIIETLLIVMSDASGGTKFSVYGAVAYLRHTYEDNTFGWLLISACSKIAGEGLTIVIKELKGAKLATDLAKRVAKCLNIPKECIYYFVDNTIIIDQIVASREKGVSELTRGVGNLIARVANEISEGHLRFVPSEYNSADNLTRIRTVDELFKKEATWFRPHINFDQIGVPHFERMQIKKVFEHAMVATDCGNISDAELGHLKKKLDNAFTVANKEQATRADLQHRSNLFTMATNKLQMIVPEKMTTLRNCNCNQSERPHKTDVRICETCMMNLPNETAELCSAGTEPVKEKSERSPHFPDTTKDLLEFLDDQFCTTNNIQIVVGNVFHMVKQKPIENIISQKFYGFLEYVKSNRNCQCFYCASKREIPLLSESRLVQSEYCSVAYEEVQQFLPREVFYSFEKEKTNVAMNLPEYCATFLMMVYTEQHKYFFGQIHTLMTEEALAHSDILSSTSPFYHRKTELLHMGGRIGMGGSGRRDQEFKELHSSHYKLILPHHSKLTKAFVLNIHQRNQCCTTSFTRLVLNEQFYVPRATSTIKSAILKCTVCLLARNSEKKLEPLTGNVKAFRLPHPADDKEGMNRPYRVAYYDFKGPLRVNDDRRFKSADAKKDSRKKADGMQQIKVYILSMTCALTRHTTFELCEDRSYESTKMAIQRIFYERGTSRLLISDQEPSFKALQRDLTDKEAKETIAWMEGWKNSAEKSDLEKSFGTQFMFQNPESSELMGLVERMHKTITHSMLSLKQADLRLSQVTTLIKGLQCMVNKRPLCGMNQEGTEAVDFSTPNMLLTGYDLNVCPSYSLPKCGPKLIQSREDIIQYSKHMKAVYSRVWGKFILSYVEDLNLYKKKNQQSRPIKVGDYVIYSGMNKEMSPINVYQICRVLQVIQGRDGDQQIRSLKVKMIKGGKFKEFTRNVRRFSLLELDETKPPTKDSNESPSTS